MTRNNYCFRFIIPNCNFPSNSTLPCCHKGDERNTFVSTTVPTIRTKIPWTLQSFGVSALLRSLPSFFLYSKGFVRFFFFFCRSVHSCSRETMSFISNFTASFHGERAAFNSPHTQLNLRSLASINSKPTIRIARPFQVNSFFIFTSLINFIAALMLIVFFFLDFCSPYFGVERHISHLPGRCW